MEKINSEAALRTAILQLEAKQAHEGKMLKEQFNVAFESIKPVNLIKSTLKEVTESPELKDKAINTMVGLTAGYLSKIIFEAVSNSPDKKVFGSAIQQGVRNTVANNREVVKSLGIGFMRIILSKSSDRVNGVGNSATKKSAS